MKLACCCLPLVLLITGCVRGPQTSELPANAVIKGVSYVGATVSSLDESAELYRQATDVDIVEELTISSNAAFDALAERKGVVAQTTMLRGVNAQLRLMAFANPSPAAMATEQMEVFGPGIMHVCFQVDQKTEAYSRFLTGGATHMGARDLQQLNPRNPVYYGYARDQDGLIVEFEEVDVAALKLPAPPKNRYRIRQVALATPDVVRLSDFYALLLEQPEFRRTGDWFFTRMRGETFDKVVGLTELSGEAAWFQIRNLELEIFQFHSHPTKPLSTPRPIDALGYNMIVFDVADLDAARELLLKAGGTLATDVQDMDGGEMLFGRDPDGNLLGFQSAPTDAVVSSQNFKNNGIE